MSLSWKSTRSSWSASTSSASERRWRRSGLSGPGVQLPARGRDAVQDVGPRVSPDGTRLMFASVKSPTSQRFCAEPSFAGANRVGKTSSTFVVRSRVRSWMQTSTPSFVTARSCSTCPSGGRRTSRRPPPRPPLRAPHRARAIVPRPASSSPSRRPLSSGQHHPANVRVTSAGRSNSQSGASRADAARKPSRSAGSADRYVRLYGWKLSPSDWLA